MCEIKEGKDLHIRVKTPKLEVEKTIAAQEITKLNMLKATEFIRVIDVLDK